MEVGVHGDDVDLADRRRRRSRWTFVQQNAASRPSRSWSRKPSGSNHGSRSRCCSVARSQPPCSGCQANAALFTSSHARFVAADDERAQWRRRRRSVERQGERPAHLAAARGRARARASAASAARRRRASCAHQVTCAAAGRAIASARLAASSSTRRCVDVAGESATDDELDHEAVVAGRRLGVADQVAVGRRSRHDGRRTRAARRATRSSQQVVVQRACRRAPARRRRKRPDRGRGRSGVRLAEHLEIAPSVEATAQAQPERPTGRPAVGRRMGAPRTPKGRAKAVAARLAEEYPEALCELDHRNAVRAAGGHDPVGADHRRPGEHGDARRCSPATPTPQRWPAPTRPSWRRSSARPASTRSRREPDRHGAGARRPVRRRGAHRARRPGHAAGRRPQDRQRGAQRRVRPAGPAGRHPRRPAVAAGSG